MGKLTAQELAERAAQAEPESGVFTTRTDRGQPEAKKDKDIRLSPDAAAREKASGAAGPDADRAPLARRTIENAGTHSPVAQRRRSADDRAVGTSDADPA